ncbi:hypothetical protein SH2C18_31380 [Clostridium sediminicola]|uniref:hypothetical protein n=1 Tax=Clostridium sediminicola TaxID=3114879 RepID=UPI0031F1F245
MERIIREIIGQYLNKKINKIWAICSKTGHKIPYIVEEAGFNSLLISSIYKYIEENEQEFSFAVSEASIERNGSKGCRGDIIWYREENICYFELKGSCYGASSGVTDVKNAKKALDYAKYQLQGINCVVNEEWYKVKANNRYFCNLAMLQSINRDGESNYDQIKEELQKNDDIKIFSMNKFSNGNLPIITDGKIEYKNDGYFIIGNIYNMENIK